MKCNYALRYIFNDAISVKKKQEIDEHVSSCPYCQGQIKTDAKVARFLEEVPPVERDAAFWQQLLRDIRAFRERKLQSPAQRLFDALPIEPVLRKMAYAGIAASVILLAGVLSFLPPETGENQAAEDTPPEIEFFQREHSLMQGNDMFGGSGLSDVFLSSYGGSRRTRY